LKAKDTRAWYRVSVCAFYFVQGLVFSSWASRIPDIKNALHMNDAQLGGVLLMMPVGQFVTMALSGYLVSTFGSKRVLGFAALLYPLMLVAIGLVATQPQLYVILFLFGVCANLSNIAVNTQAVGVERLYGRSIMGVFHGLWSLAGFTGGLVGTLMASLGVTPFYHFCMVYALLLCVVFGMRRTLLPRDAQRTGEHSRQRKIFTRPDAYVLILGFIALGNMVCEGFVFDWSGVYFKDVVAAPADFVRLGYVAAMGAMALGRFTIDRFIARFGVINVLRFGGVTIVGGLLLAGISPNIVPSTIGFLMLGAGISPAVPICYSLAGRSKTLLPGVAIAAVSSISFLGLFSGPPLIGVVSEGVGLRWALGLVILFGVAVLSLTVVLKGKLSAHPRK